MKTNQLQKILNQIPSSIYLAIAVIVFAASNPITRRVVDIGNQNLIDGRNPISLCNVLFVGNICALGLMLFIFHRHWHHENLKALTTKDWISLTITGILSGAIAPALIFTALGITNITNIVLIGRIEPILSLVLGFWLLSIPLNPWIVSGSVVSFAGIVVTALLSSSAQNLTMGAFQLGTGEVLVALAAVITSISTIVNKLQLQSIPIGIFMIYRNIVGSIIFFLIAIILYGKEHFADAFSPLLWQLMLLYATLIVVFGQLCWLTGLTKATITELNLASLCNPIAAIIMAYLILGEVPTQAQYMGGSLLLVGFIFSFIGNFRQNKINRDSSKVTHIKAMEIVVGFKGV
ncbi:DMT family transporter [Pseudanabaena sp. FACHB-1277]|uniref:DMT family transporter n=1 Tax=Pseudanabaena cinerea FACHB-1277 TaxID=2949581 RepID=A0A926Z9Q8_9CYAN|nr:DMT family transporter [Pseudanabaena cinerea]MBD2152074.1 DMT family transporter [Pseudanabaena cinerea FACHB-1277]